jgi:hypothetical protein
MSQEDGVTRSVEPIKQEQPQILAQSTLNNFSSMAPDNRVSVTKQPVMEKR